MRIAEINMLLSGSTGTIMLQIAKVAREHGFASKTYTPVLFFRGRKTELPSIPNHFYWGSRAEAFCHYYVGTLLGRNGMYSRKGTRQLIKDLEDFKPDIIHLHNLHMYCINFSMLFNFIKRNGIKVVWTLHDCWSFTGKCPHFTIAECDKWKSECHNCPQTRKYPKAYRDTSKIMYRRKKEWFCGVKDMTIVAPSQWLADLVEQSFLKEYPIKVINNGVNLSVFKPQKSDFREKYGLQNKKIILGVAFGWGYGKGLDVFIELSNRLDCEKYQIVLVGTDSETDKQLPDSIISIHRTGNQKELAEIYTAADLMVNPTREEVFGLVNVEANACGTPVLAFKTGGCPECIDEKSGSIVECDDVDTLEREILRICTTTPYSEEACVERAKKFDMNDRFEEYIELYKKVMNL